ncbi:probable ADP-ribosylation factor GTPase-activating protein AGD14 isoform X2 [Nymphaea colorata]|nr:probable ADP-ribosylation factor GTPase-activating protein AGD14 isoform X2 [Nymphaea colorata]
MSNRMKEDEKNEKIIRGLLKLPANRKCINCNSLGPQYVCTSFWTFICTTCSGIHREFTHRVKSVSMAKFSPQEVEALQNGGNERAKEIYFKEWDPQRHSAPDGSNVDGVRTFIKSVYVDRKYSGERGVDRLGRGDRKDSKENNYGPRHSGGMSPGGKRPEQTKYDDRGYSGRNSRTNVDRRSLSNYEESYKKSPRLFEVVDDRFRDDNFLNGNQQKKGDDRTFANRHAKREERSNNNQNKPDTSSPPIVHPISDLLGEDVPSLWVGEPAKSDAASAADDSACTQKAASSTSIGSNEGNTAELKRGNSGSLIDFAEDPEPSVAAIQSDPFSSQSVSQAPDGSSLGSSDWLSLNNSSQENANVASLNPATPASVLAQLSVQAAEPVSSISMVPVIDSDSLAQPSSGEQLQAIQQQPSPSSGADALSTNINFSQPVKGAPNGQSWNSALVSDSQMLLTAQTVQPSEVASLQAQESKEEARESNAADAKKDVRKALPEDIFTLYAAGPVPVFGWQPRPHIGLNFGGHHPNAVPMSIFPESSRSTNPFDFATEPATSPVTTFPSMSPLQRPLPTMNLSSSSAPNPQWMPSQSLAIPMSPSAGCYMAQHPPSRLEPVG